MKSRINQTKQPDISWKSFIIRIIFVSALIIISAKVISALYHVAEEHQAKTQIQGNAKNN